MANILKPERRAAVVAALVEGNSINATVRMTGVAKNTILKLLVELGDVCAAYQDKHLRNLPCKRLQADELWAFCYAKAKHVPAEKKGTFGYGDVWTFVAVDADTKLVASFLVGSRDSGSATEFMQDLASRMAGRVQLTTDWPQDVPQRRRGRLRRRRGLRDAPKDLRTGPGRRAPLQPG